jgi:diguanylate cyclase (GGDEF)-like protein
MNSAFNGVVVVPGVVALLLFLVFTYLYEQSRQNYFRAWQLGWGAYTLHFALDAWGAWGNSPRVAYIGGSALLVLMAMCVLVSVRLVRDHFRIYWTDVVLTCGLVAVAGMNLVAHMRGGIFNPQQPLGPPYRLEVGIAAVLLIAAAQFYRHAYHKSSLAFRLLSLSLASWAVLMAAGQFQDPWIHRLDDYAHVLGPVPQMLLGISMVMVLFEQERDTVQDNALAFSTLGVDLGRLLSAEELVPSMQSLLDRLATPLPKRRAILYVPQRWRSVLPSVQRGFGPEMLTRLERSGAGEYITELAYSRGGFVSVRNVEEMTEPLPAFTGDGFQQFKDLLLAEHIRHFTAVSLQTREHNFGVLLFPHAERTQFGVSTLRLMTGQALQMGLTLENYVVMHESLRRTKEYELLTDIGQAITARLDQDEVLRTVQKELGLICDTSNFYIAFQEGGEIRFELETDDGRTMPKRVRPIAEGLTEYILRTGEPLLIRADLETARKQIGVSYHVPGRMARSYCGVPILLNGKPAGVMAALSRDHEYAFEQRDLELMMTAAGQVSVAVENARLFAEEQERSRQLGFLNRISRTAISSEDAAEMLAEIVSEIQKNFSFDHIGIGILDYATKDIEIRAEAGATHAAIGRRFPLGSGIVGRVARSGELAQVRRTPEEPAQGILPESRSVLCIPITYGETLLGVLNVESQREQAFGEDDVLILKTLADLLATALHNSFVFQKLQQQSITDSLTGVKTRRYFWEAVSSECKRASRSGRAFSVVLLDLDKFKEVNDTSGHLEGDLVLARVGRLLEQQSRQSNVVARYGGDEFIVLMPETGSDQAQVLAERLRQTMATDPMLAQHRITGSFGVASFPVHGLSLEEIVRAADAAMYTAKNAGGNQVALGRGGAGSEEAALQRQQFSAFVEGFLRREHIGPESLEELVGALRKIARGNEGQPVHLLREYIETLNQAAEMREAHGSGHGDGAAQYAEIIGRALDLSPDELSDLVFAARVHDVGKIFIPERILNKSGPLTEEEYYVVKMHAGLSAQIVATLPHSESIQKAIAHHHEAFNGSGYPDGLRGEEIPLWARIVGLADAFANMTSDRSFAPAKTTEQALAELESMTGTRYDGMLVRILGRQLKVERAPKTSSW